MSTSPDWDGYGSGWEDLRKKTLKRDDYTCQRCGYDLDSEDRDVPLQAHHVIPRSQGGPDSLDNLVTLCRGCHGVQHPNNEEFAEDRAEAPIFPTENADNRVSQLHPSQDAQCDRCASSVEDPTFDLIGIPEEILGDSTATFCKGCSGVILSRNEAVSTTDLLWRVKPSWTKLHTQQTKVPPLAIQPNKFDVDTSRDPVNNIEEVFSVSGLRKLGSVIAFLLSFVIFYYYFGPVYLGYNSPNGFNMDLFVLSWITSVIVGPSARWILGGFVYKIGTLVDPMFDSDKHYVPTLSRSVVLAWKGVKLGIGVSIGIAIISILLVAVIGVIVS